MPSNWRNMLSAAILSVLYNVRIMQSHKIRKLVNMNLI